jgi:hypothetical protein
VDELGDVPTKNDRKQSKLYLRSESWKERKREEGRGDTERDREILKDGSEDRKIDQNR